MSNPDSITEGSPNQLPDSFGDPDPEPGDLLKLPIKQPEDQAKVAKLALKMWESQDKVQQPRLVRWKVNAARRRGASNIYAVKDQDESKWIVWTPPGQKPKADQAMNKADTLCDRLTALVFADPPAAECVPATGEEADVNAAEFATRVLEDVQSESGLNTQGKARKAFNRANVSGSGFVRYWVDGRGGGREPIEVLAGFDPATGEEAQTAQDAAVKTVMIPPPMDPFGMPMGEPQTLQEPWPDYRLRYVMPDGTLTDNKKEAAERWVPQVKSEVLAAKNVRMFPHTAEDVWEAEAVQIAVFRTLGELKNTFPELRKLDEEQVKRLLKYKPENAKDLMPAGHKGESSGKPDRMDEELVFTLLTYYDGKKCPDTYPDGLYLVTLGDSAVAFRDAWMKELEDETVLLDLPVTQFKQFDSGRDDPYGYGLMDKIGAGNELRAAQLGGFLDYMEWLMSRKTFLGTNSTINPRELQLPFRTVVSMNPGGKPEYEDIPSFPGEGFKLFEMVSAEMDNASALEQTAQGMESSDVGSGRHAYAIISQVHAALSEVKQNVERGYTRASRIELQLIRTHYDTPRQIRWAGEDGRYKQDDWSGSDLGSTRDVRIKPGTMTMLAPVSKAALAEKWAAMQIIPPEELREIVTSNLGGLVAMQDDPFRMRIRQQKADWEEGPEEGAPEPPPVPQIDPMTGLAAIGPDGQPIMVPQPDPKALAIWAPVPADALPNVAKLRLAEIAKLMSTNRYSKHPPSWRAAVDMEFQRMLQASMPAPQPMPTQSGKPPEQGPPDPGVPKNEIGPGDTPEPPFSFPNGMAA